MTLERASEIVAAITADKPKIDLFCHFVDLFDLRDARIEQFAEMCQFGICRNVTVEN